MMKIIKVSFLTLIILISLYNINTLLADNKLKSYELKILSPELAMKIVKKAVDHCFEKGYKVSAAVVDRNGNLAAFLRHPLSGSHTISTAQR